MSLEQESTLWNFLLSAVLLHRGRAVCRISNHKADCFPIKAGWRWSVLTGDSWSSLLPGEWDIMYWCECPDGQAVLTSVSSGI